MAIVQGNIRFNSFVGNYDKLTNSSVQYYKTPVLPTNFNVLSYYQTHSETPQTTETGAGGTQGYAFSFRTFIYNQNNYIERSNYLSEDLLSPSGTAVASYTGENSTGTIDLGIVGQYYLIEYTILEYRISQSSSGEITRSIVGAYCEIFSVLTATNKHPLKRLTCKDVVNRILALIEPLQKWQSPRFTLEEKTAETLDKVYCPELTITRSTLREALQQVGHVAHGEPRLKNYTGTSATVTYDFYGGKRMSQVRNMPYVSKMVKWAIDHYCTSIDSTAENLSNQLDWVSSTVIEPYKGGFKTVRAESQYVRINDENMLIQTAYPIMKVIKLECGIVPNNTVSINYADITPYVFESTLYGSQLSSYIGNYPYSKAYGLYYTQGQKNIQGLNFKSTDAVPIADAFGKYAIVNIIEAATGRSAETLTSGVDYPQLAFRVTYIPFFGVRVGQSKPYYKEAEDAAVLAYNQSANVIESRYYGENVKGTVARLGNIEKSITYVCSWFDQIPKAGQLYDDDYYISAVAWQALPNYIKVTVGLSKDFNRISQYIGVSSNRRYYEVSERQAYDRSTLYREYIVIGDKVTETGSAVSDLSLRVVLSVAWMFRTPEEYEDAENALPAFEQEKVTNVLAWGGTYSDPEIATLNGEPITPLPLVRLPVVSCALGNAMVFIWNYKDNYSAGDVSTYAQNGSVSGYFQDDYQYTDYYGRMYYYNFALAQDWPAPQNLSEQTNIGGALPGADVAVSDLPTDIWRSCYLYRKDNREIPQFNASVEFVTNRKGYIVGSALSARNSLVYTNGAGWRKSGDLTTNFAKLYILQEPLSKFAYGLNADGIDLTDASQATEIEYTVNFKPEEPFSVTFTIPKACKAWAFVTPAESYTETVEDEEGNVSQQTYQKGGELLFGCNGDFTAGQVIPDIYFTPVHDIYKNAVQGSKSTVTFTVAVSGQTFSYTVPDGMTFRQFIRSKYNDGKFGVGGQQQVIFLNNNTAYTIQYVSGSTSISAIPDMAIENRAWTAAEVLTPTNGLGGAYPFFLDDTLTDQQRYYAVYNYYMSISDPVLRFAAFAEDTAAAEYAASFYATLYDRLLSYTRT